MLLILVLLVLGFWVSGRLKKMPVEAKNELLKRLGWAVGGILLVLLVATGKLNWLFALIGVVIATIVRLMPVILNYAPQLHRLWTMFGSAARQQQSSRTQRSATMTKAEALEVLGLKANASEADIIQAHRKLIARVHPDKGGSDYLAAQINLAKKTLLQR